MWQTVRIVSTAAVLALGAGCLSGPLVEGPALVAAGVNTEVEQNPVFVPLGPESYGQVFENVLQVLGDAGFEIQESNRYDGRIEAIPRVAPGVGLFLKPGSPSLYERVLATLQTYRHRVSVNIQPAENGGFFVEVIARKELEDLARPIRSTAGAAIFRNDNNVERQFEVIDPAVFEPTWIFRGRDTALEQKLIQWLKGCM
jgi:hypothetical protein